MSDTNENLAMTSGPLGGLLDDMEDLFGKEDFQKYNRAQTTVGQQSRTNLVVEQQSTRTVQHLNGLPPTSTLVTGPAMQQQWATRNTLPNIDVMSNSSAGGLNLNTPVHPAANIVQTNEQTTTLFGLTDADVFEQGENEEIKESSNNGLIQNEINKPDEDVGAHLINNDQQTILPNIDISDVDFGSVFNKTSNQTKSVGQSQHIQQSQSNPITESHNFSQNDSELNQSEIEEKPTMDQVIEKAIDQIDSQENSDEQQRNNSENEENSDDQSRSNGENQEISDEQQRINGQKQEISDMQRNNSELESEIHFYQLLVAFLVLVLIGLTYINTQGGLTKLYNDARIMFKEYQGDL